MSETRTFPDGFLWATATAAHQVEGDNRNNDWWQFEQQPGRIAQGQVSGPACDTWNRYREDFVLYRKMGNNAHRLSIEWSRVEPREGEFDPKALRRYRDMLGELREQGMQPMVTLHHFSSPTWFSNRGGWGAAGAPAAWLPFVSRVVDELGDLVTIWCTINEPNIYATQGWIFGAFPPGRRNDVRGLWRVLGNLHTAHEAAYRIIKKRWPDAPAGLAHNKFWLKPFSNSPLDRAAARTGRMAMDFWPVGNGRMRPTVTAISDYIGLNHYSGRLVRFDPGSPGTQFIRNTNPPGFPISDFGDAIRSDWLREAIDELRPYGKPIYVTENGIATRDDAWRQDFLRGQLGAVQQAIAKGADVRGFFHWTSLDNFEWAHGYNMQFGLIAVDRATLERRPKGSYHLFGRMARANAIVE